MLINKISDLTASDERAVIINVGTKWVSTLALMSALKYVNMPILLIDCESKDGSMEHFEDLAKSHEFDLLSVPLKKHGVALDWIFKNIPSKKVLLIDSDLEILGSEIIAMMKNFMDHKNVFGSGFIHGPCWLHHHQGIGYYQERMWIPLTMLKTAFVREALQMGLSFGDGTIPNDFPPFFYLSKLLMALRFRMPLLWNRKLSWLNGFKNTYNGLKPSYVYCDTGAAIYQYLKYRKGLHFVGFPAELHEQYATHFHGITRLSLDPEDLNGTDINHIMLQVMNRLKQAYGILAK